MHAVHHDRQTIARLTPLAAVLAKIGERRPVAVRSCAVADVVGKTLGSDLRCSHDRPVRAIALRDGWAVRAEATADAGPFAPAPLSAAHMIDLGSPLPAGTDAVLPFESVDTSLGLPAALAPIAPGDGVLAAGADTLGDEPLRRVGERLRPIDRAILSALGVDEVAVRVPRLTIVSAVAGPDVVRDAIIDFIVSAATDSGCRVERAEDEDDLTRLAGAADAVVRIGGTGTGRNDTSVRALARAGEVFVHGIALAPGETAAYGRVGDCPVLLMPGRFDAALAVWLTLGQTLVRRMCGSAEAEARPEKLARKIASAPGLVEIVLVRRSGDGVEPIAAGHLPMAASARADGFVVVPAEREGFAAGALVPVRAL